jgi:hypothetical protein
MEYCVIITTEGSDNYQNKEGKGKGTTGDRIGEYSNPEEDFFTSVLI